MRGTERDDADEHSKVEDVKELRMRKAQYDDATDFRQRDSAEYLREASDDHHRAG